MTKFRKYLLLIIILVLVGSGLVLVLVNSKKQVVISQTRNNLALLYQKSLAYYLNSNTWPQAQDWPELFSVLDLNLEIFSNQEYLFCPDNSGLTVAAVTEPSLLKSGETLCLSNRQRSRRINLDCQETVDRVTALICVKGK